MYTLKRIRLNQNESILKYAINVQAIYNKILLVYDANTELSEREFYRKKVKLEKETMKQFINKMLQHLDYKVTVLRPRNLANIILCAKKT